MKTKFLFIVFFQFIYIFCSAQVFQFPDFAKPDHEEIDIKQCPFDLDANAIILLHEAFSDYDEKYQLITYHHVRIKILNEKGKEAANIKIPYWRKDDFEDIINIDALTLNMEAGGKLVKTKVGDDQIYKQKTTDRYGEVVFAFPNVKPGSIIEYRYQSVMKHYGGLNEWVFQDELPVLISRYKLSIVPNAEFAYRVSKSPNLPIIISEPDKGMIYFEMQNIPSLSDEPFMDARRDYLQKVVFQLSGFNNTDFGKTKYSNSWEDLIRELSLEDNFGGQLNKNIPGTSELIRQLANFKPEEKMKTIYDYVKTNMAWNRVNSIFSADGVKSSWQKKQGTSADINLVLVNLLKEAGLDAYPLLVSERYYGKVNTDYPFLDQFNTVFAYITIGNKKYFLDATDHFTPAHLIPYDILNTTALIVNRKNGGLIKITNEDLQYDEMINIRINLSEADSISGAVTVKSNDYARVKKLSVLKTGKENYLDTYFRTDGNVTINNFEILNEDRDSLPFEQTCSFTLKSNAEDKYKYIPLNLFSGFMKNPFLQENRFSNINFGFKRTINVNVTISYSNNYTVDALPKNIKLINADNDIIISRKLEYDKDKSIILCSLKFEFKNSIYPVEAYSTIRDLYKKMIDIVSEPVVLKKK